MKDRRIKILLIEDNPAYARLIKDMLLDAKNISFELECADRLSAGLDRLAQGGIDVVLLDLMLPDSEGLATFIRAQAAAPEVPIIVLTGLADEDLAASAVRSGAQDYLTKGHMEGDSLVRAIRYAIERTRAEAAL